MKEIVIASAVRTPIGSFLGGLQDVSAVELGAHVIQEALKRANVPGEAVDEVLMGNVLQAGLGQNPARQAQMKAGIPYTANATTINIVCGSGLKAVMQAVQTIRSGEAQLMVAGGMENMSQAPYILKKARTGYRMGDGQLVDVMMNDGLACAILDIGMGITAESIAAKYGITREEQDAFALSSQQKVEQARLTGMFDEELTPVTYFDKKGKPVSIVADEHPRAGMTIDMLAKLKPSFQRDGSVTAGNSSGINDGAAAVVVCSKERAMELDLQPLAKIRSFAAAGVDPAYMGLGPVPAVRLALQSAGLTMNDIGLVELNEAFSVQSLAVMRDLELDPSIVNPYGGAIALGHPIGASGARVLTTLLHGMKRRSVELGLVSLCVGGGQGVAMVVEQL
ncbi:acetyl-CoA C-acetyltransferase [Paenibacillus sp. N1-5-1-14]|uniref:acetyl-CoA C-acetyltransferase n=1 Tax=Paenibacillus radicibacter TaxID=2972488 RepID=UPI002158B088|nr:acetyl-CoA C-acetyltransferase [Paenibacillus radicibacter]MCR8644166.1 acetyl-CoA C-acetyltransferase [Paenibacillus radicibacter]